MKIQETFLITEKNEVIKHYEQGSKEGFKRFDKRVKEANRVVLDLRQQQSSGATRVAEAFAKLDEKFKQISEERNKMAPMVVDYVRVFFDEADELLTREIRTKSYSLLIYKETERTFSNKVNWKKVISDIIKDLKVDKTKIDNIINRHTKETDKGYVRPTIKTKQGDLREALDSEVTQEEKDLLGLITELDTAADVILNSLKNINAQNKSQTNESMLREGLWDTIKNKLKGYIIKFKRWFGSFFKKYDSQLFEFAERYNLPEPDKVDEIMSGQ